MRLVGIRFCSILSEHSLGNRSHSSSVGLVTLKELNKGQKVAKFGQQHDYMLKCPAFGYYSNF